MLLTELPNIGKVVAGKLEEAGIVSPEELRTMGSRAAFEGIRLRDHTACLQMLYALEGAVQGIRSNDLSEPDKQALKVFYNSLKPKK